MRILLNGDAAEIPGPMSVQQLLDHLEIDPRLVAVEHNRVVVKRATFSTTMIDEDAEVEIVAFVGGGATLAKPATMLKRLALSVVVVLTGAAPAHAQLRSDLIAGGLSAPVAIAQDPSHPGRQLIAEQGGRVRVVLNGALQPVDFLNLTGLVSPGGGEQGLLGVAFAPDFASSGRIFVSFTNTAGDSVISRYVRASDSPLIAEVSSRFDLRWPTGQTWIDQPFANHNGGHLAFGPDGYLYVGLGDGGSGNDPFHYAQTPTTLLGKMLRIDVSVSVLDPEGYDVPPTNPFAGSGVVLPEIWSFGLRNPWRYSFDDPARSRVLPMRPGRHHR